MDPAAEPVITAQNVDLTSCDRELIQFPQAIQPHGVMLTVDEASNLILHASANCAELIGAGPAQILGKPISGLLGRDGRDLSGPLRRLTLDAGPVHLARESFVGSDRGFHLFAHRSGGLIVLELENAAKTADAPPARLYSDLRADMARLQATKTLAEFFDLAVQRIRDFTGYDRVMAYRFDEDGSGEVVAESKRDELETYLGLHYPASDIPAPARRLFSLAWVRHLPDVDYTPVPLVASADVVTGPVDMSFASLRSVSVMYTDYLRNMGVRSSMVMPLMKEGRLWGLISAMHHQGPRHAPHETRMAAEFLAHTLSLMMSAKEDADIFERVISVGAAAERLIPMLTRERADLAKLAPPLLALVEAGGVAAVSGGRVERFGKTPDEAEIADLAQWLGGHGAPLFATDRLAALYPPALPYADIASGVLAAELGEAGEWLIWFRPERIADVTWAGDPHKPVDVVETDGALRLRPRGSFALWKESVRNRSLPWREHQKNAALKLREGIVAFAREQAQKLGELESVRSETDAFTQAASQELKEQLRGLHHLAVELNRRQGDVWDEEGRRQAAAILKIAQRMDGLADALMQHARVGRGGMDRAPVDLDEVVDEALRAAHLDANVEVRRPSRLGVAVCDRAWVAEAFASLIDNAVRYNDKPRRWIEIGAAPGEPPRYYVRDNGVGVAEADAGVVFEMFRRLHGQGEFGGGAGVGLAFARKIVERHGGRLWVESTPGEGSTFSFTLAPEGSA